MAGEQGHLEQVFVFGSFTEVEAARLQSSPLPAADTRGSRLQPFHRGNSGQRLPHDTQPRPPYETSCEAPLLRSGRSQESSRSPSALIARVIRPEIPTQSGSGYSGAVATPSCEARPGNETVQSEEPGSYGEVNVPMVPDKVIPVVRQSGGTELAERVNAWGHGDRRHSPGEQPKAVARSRAAPGPNEFGTPRPLQPDDGGRAAPEFGAVRPLQPDDAGRAPLPALVDKLPIASQPSSLPAPSAQAPHAAPTSKPPVVGSTEEPAADVMIAAAGWTSIGGSSAVGSVPPTATPASSTQPAPVKPALVQPASVQPAPVQPAPIQPAPVQPAPVPPAPVQPAPVQPAPVQHAPVQRTPGQPAPVQPVVQSAVVQPAPGQPTTAQSTQPAPVKRTTPISWAALVSSPLGTNSQLVPAKAPSAVPPGASSAPLGAVSVDSPAAAAVPGTSPTLFAGTSFVGGGTPAAPGSAAGGAGRQHDSLEETCQAASSTPIDGGAQAAASEPADRRHTGPAVTSVAPGASGASTGHTGPPVSSAALGASGTPEPKGFVNRGNLCFANATLQALLGSSAFVQLLQDMHSKPEKAKEPCPTTGSFLKFWRVLREAPSHTPTKPPEVAAQASSTAQGAGGEELGAANAAQQASSSSPPPVSASPVAVGSQPWAGLGSQSLASSAVSQRAAGGTSGAPSYASLAKATPGRFLAHLGPPVDPAVTFESVLTRFSPQHHRNGVQIRQEDAQEFLSFLLDRMHEELQVPEGAEESGSEWSSMNGDHHPMDGADGFGGGWETMGRRNKTAKTRTHKMNKSEIKSLFFGELKSEVKIPGSKPASATCQPFSVLQLDISRDAVRSVEDALVAFGSPEQVEGYRPQDGVGSHATTASKVVKFQELPPVLILHIMRFTYGPRGSIKLHKPVAFPLRLVLAPDLVASSPLAAPQGRTYKLVATVVHHGKDPSRGHYTADVRQLDDSWLRFDDGNVSSIPVNRVVREQAYLLLYERVQG